MVWLVIYIIVWIAIVFLVAKYAEESAYKFLYLLFSLTIMLVGFIIMVTSSM